MVFAGESPAVKELGGILVKTIPLLQSPVYQKDLPRNIQVDISSLKEFNNTILAGSIILPHGVELEGYARNRYCHRSGTTWERSG